MITKEKEPEIDMRTLMKKNGFTLVELLVVMGIIGILMGLLFPAIGAARNAANKTKAGVEVRSIENAIMLYFNEYGKLPIPDNKQGLGEKEYFTLDDNNNLASQWVIQILTAHEASNPRFSETMNPREIVFLEAQAGNDDGDIEDGVYLDPWGEQYMMKFDADYNGKVEFYSGGVVPDDEIITKRAIVYSFGPDPADYLSRLVSGTILPDPAFKDFISSSF